MRQLLVSIGSQAASAVVVAAADSDSLSASVTVADVFVLSDQFLS